MSIFLSSCDAEDQLLELRLYIPPSKTGLDDNWDSLRDVRAKKGAGKRGRRRTSICFFVMFAGLAIVFQTEVF